MQGNQPNQIKLSQTGLKHNLTIDNLTISNLTISNLTLPNLT